MRVSDLTLSNSVLKAVKRRSASLTYRAVKDVFGQARFVALTDAGYPQKERKGEEAQEGFIIGICFGEKKGSIFMPIIFSSRKQKKFTHSTMSSEAKALTAGLASVVTPRNAWIDISGRKLPITIVLDAQSVHKALKTDSKITDPSAGPDINMLRKEYENSVFEKLVWVPGVENPANPLTKDQALATSDILEEMLVTGKLTCDIEGKDNDGPAQLEEE